MRLATTAAAVLLAAATAPVAVFAAVDSTDTGAGELRIVNEADDEVLTVWPTDSTSRASLASSGNGAAIPIIDLGSEGCEPYPTPEGFPAALIVDRGNCSFIRKLELAEQAGALMLIVANNEAAQFNATTGMIRSPCVRNCDLASSAVSAEDCESSSPSCRSGICIPYADTSAPLFDPLKYVDSDGEDLVPADEMYCCFADPLVQMPLGDSNATIPAVFLTLRDVERVRETILSIPSPRVIAEERSRPFPNPSVYAMWFLGVIYTAAASYRAVARERGLTRVMWSSKPEGEDLLVEDESGTTGAAGDEEGDDNGSAAGKKTNPDDDLETVDISMVGAMSFLALSSVVLVGLFFLVINYPHQAVFALNVLYALGSIASMSIIVFQPLLRAAVPWLADHTVIDWKWAEIKGNGVEVAATSMAVVFAVIWLVFRHENWSWIFLNIISLALACMFLLTLRLPNLKTGAVLFGLFFVYDVFMVFISPFIFGGKSVMVEVATAGAASEDADAALGVCIRNKAERVPMLILFPRVGDFQGGYALLGLGDILIPGLLITLALRLDYSRVLMRKQAVTWLKAHTYFIILMSAYGAGLAVTYVANLLEFTINDVKGQPALLYLVPFVFGAFALSAHVRGDLKSVWTDGWNVFVLPASNVRQLAPGYSTSNASIGTRELGDAAADNGTDARASADGVDDDTGIDASADDQL